MKALSIPSLALALLVAGASGCGKSDPSSSTPAPAATSTGAAGPASAAPAGPASGAPAGGERPVLGSCNDKSSSVCKEYYGVLPLLAEDLCKGLEGKGVLTRGPTPCSRDNLSGTCDIKSDDSSETTYYYKQPDITPEMNKTVCEIVGKWTPAKASAPTAATGGAAAAKPAAADKPAAKPAAGKKKK